MPFAPERLDFAPPQQPGLPQALALAVLAHAVLLIGLTWGVQWKRESENVVAEAELWSAVPQQAAPREVVAPPPPPPPVAEKPPAPPPPPPAPERREADIALEREKQRLALEKERELQEQQERERQKRLEAQRAEAEKQAAAEKRAEAERRLAEQKRQEEARQKQAQAEKEAERRKQEQAAAAKAKAREAEDARRVAELRQENLKRLQGLAGGTGSTEGATATRASGPSAGYASRIAASIKRNIVFTESASGNPATEVRIRVAPDGTIVSKTLVRPSGNPAWDEAVLRAIDRTGSIPRDTDGSVVPEVLARFRPND